MRICYGRPRCLSPQHCQVLSCTQFLWLSRRDLHAFTKNGTTYYFSCDGSSISKYKSLLTMPLCSVLLLWMSVADWPEHKELCKKLQKQAQVIATDYEPDGPDGVGNTLTFGGWAVNSRSEEWELYWAIQSPNNEDCTHNHPGHLGNS